jgi:formate hydrogenlyase subunit 3/multisubunit Na+/H+ antiporter MnhD subunit
MTGMPQPLALVLVGAVLFAVSGLPALLVRGSAGERAGALIAVVGALLGLRGVVATLAAGDVAATVGWPLPGASFALGVDGLSALFLVPIFLIPGLAAVFGLGYRLPAAGANQTVQVFLGLLAAGMVVLVVARNGVLFLCGWETMALAAFVLIAVEHRREAARRAAWVYLVATHLGTACLIAVFVLLPNGGTLDWIVGAAMPAGRAVVVFALALFGFGLKAGVMPLHVWLPSAHANAPSHVSAVLSGVMIKTGIYGLLRVVSLLPPLPSACGILVATLAAGSALLGIAATLGQRDLKRLLAYSSIENIGIVLLGIGLMLLGRALGRNDLAVLGLGAGLLHVLNHSLFKPLLFFGAGSILHATGTRDLDALGGLLRAMPRTGSRFLLGAAAICGLPMLNGFVGEFVLYAGLFETVRTPNTGMALLGVALLASLALTGGLALVGFTRCSATVFLGRPRSPAAAAAHESPHSMTAPLTVLALACVVLGIVPWIVMPWIDRAVAGVLPGSSPIGALVPLRVLSWLLAGCLIASGVALAVLRAVRRRSDLTPGVGTWDCGFLDAASPRLQYTGSSFAQLPSRSLRVVVKEQVDVPAPLDLFPGPRSTARRPLESLLDGFLWPFVRRWADRCVGLRFLQQGNLQIYLTYILLVLLLLLTCSALFGSRPW